MDKYSYDSDVVKELFRREESTYSLDDWKFLAEFHEYHHGQWIDIAMSLLKEELSTRSAFEKLYKNFLARFGFLPTRRKLKGLLNLTRGRPRKDVERTEIKKQIDKMKLEGFTNSECLEELINRGLLKPDTDMRTFTRIKNGR